MVAVIRGHLYIEGLLSEMLHAMIPDFANMIDNEMGFAAKMQAALFSRHIPVDFMRPLVVINNLRNSFAHKLDRTPLTMDDDNGLNGSLSSEMRSLYNVVTKGMDESAFVPGLKCIFGIVAVYSVLLTKVLTVVADRWRENNPNGTIEELTSVFKKFPTVHIN